MCTLYVYMSNEINETTGISPLKDQRASNVHMPLPVSTHSAQHFGVVMSRRMERKCCDPSEQERNDGLERTRAGRRLLNARLSKEMTIR